jgi:hypothetical protein
MNSISILIKFFDEESKNTPRAYPTTVDPLIKINLDQFLNERSRHICNLLLESTDVVDKDFDLVYYFYSNNNLLYDMYKANVAHLEKDYLIYSFVDLKDKSISRVTFVDFNNQNTASVENIKYRLRLLKN